MKILVACIDMVPENINRQPWFYMNCITKGLREKGHDVWILTDGINKSEDRKTIFYKDFRSFPNGVSEGIGALVMKQGFDAVIWSTGLSDFFFRKKIDTLGVPVIAVVTSPRYSLRELLSLGKDLLFNREFVGQFFLGPILSKQRVIDFLSIPNLKAVVFECNETLRRYIPYGFDKKEVAVISPPLPEDFLKILKEVKAEENTEPKNYFKILYFGPPLNLRGIDILVHAISLIRKKVENVRLLILSRIEYEGLLKHEKRLNKLIKRENLGTVVQVVSGVLTQKEIIRQIISSDLVCLPFKFAVSDVPIAILETVATGVPLITTEVLGISEFRNSRRCYVVPRKDPKSLAEEIFKVIQDKGEITRNMPAMDNLLKKHSLKNFTISYERVVKEAS